MGRQHDFRMNNAAFSCIVVGQSVPLVCQLLSGAVGCCGYGRFALSPADNLNAAMVDCDSITSYNKIVVFIDRSPAECYNKLRMLWIGGTSPTAKTVFGRLQPQLLC